MLYSFEDDDCIFMNRSECDSDRCYWMSIEKNEVGLFKWNGSNVNKGRLLNGASYRHP